MADGKIIDSCRRLWKESGEGTWLLALSGGADSTALFMALLRGGVPFRAAHCNFNLRGAESVRDRDFVASLCRNFGVKCHIAEFDTLNEMGRGESVEMACRRLRYDFFRQTVAAGSYSRIAVAHNADDNAETFLLNAFRGSGSRGLRGMETDSGEIVRPLLEFRRKELLEFLESLGQGFVTDSSNLLSDSYKRNFLRNEIMPLLESRWQGLSKALRQTIAIQRKENAIVEHFVEKALDGVGTILPWERLREFPDRETLIFRFINPHGGTPVTASEMSAAVDKGPISGKEWKLSDDTYARFTRNGIRIASSKPSCPMEFGHDWTPIGDIGMDRILSAPLSEVYLPCPMDRYEWQMATKEMRIKPLGMRGSQSVWKVLKDAGIPAGERGLYPVLVDRSTHEPIWIPSLRRSGLHLISPSAAPDSGILRCYIK